MRTFVFFAKVFNNDKPRFFGLYPLEELPLGRLKFRVCFWQEILKVYIWFVTISHKNRLINQKKDCNFTKSFLPKIQLWKRLLILLFLFIKSLIA